MTRRALIRCVLSLLLVVYLIVMVTVSRRARAASTLQGVDIEVNDTLHTGFITAADVQHQIQNMFYRFTFIKENIAAVDAVHDIWFITHAAAFFSSELSHTRIGFFNISAVSAASVFFSIHQLF